MKALPSIATALTIAEKLIEQTGVIGEKIDISACQAVKALLRLRIQPPG
jgi:hypothetical protein